MKVLLIGSSFSAAPIFFVLRNLGAHISVVGRDPSDPCHAYADQSIFEDYSDREALLAVCEEEAFDYIVPSCNDYAYMAAIHVADKLGYPGFDNPEVARALHTKDAYRSLLQDLGIPSPQMYGELSAGMDVKSMDVRMPAILKPVDSFSGRGVQIVQKAEDLDSALASALSASREKRAIVEQFVDGRLYSHTGFISDGRIFWHEFVDEFCEVYPFAVDRSRFPSDLPREMKSRVHKGICRLVEKLQLCDGLIHTQFIANEDSFFLIECMRRCPGDLYGHQMELACGIDYASLYTLPFVGKLYDTTTALPVPHQAVERRVVAADSSFPFFGLEISELGAPAEFIPLKGSGEMFEAAPFDKAGIFFYSYPLGSLEEKEAICLHATPLGYS